MKIEDMEVGKKYRLRKDLVTGQRYGSLCYFSLFDPAPGSIVTIKEIDANNELNIGTGYLITPEMLSGPVEKKRSKDGRFAKVEKKEPIYIWNGKTLSMVDQDGVHELTDKLYMPALFTVVTDMNQLKIEKN